MKILLFFSILLFSFTSSAVTPYFPPLACVMTAVNATQRTSFSQPGVVQGFTTGCLVVQQDTNIIYEWDGSSYSAIGGGGMGLLSLNAQTGQTQIFANDTNITITSSNNTHALGWASTLSVARGGTGAALSPALGDVVYSDASKLVLLAAGTSGQFLQSNGAGAPSWASPTGGITSLNSQTGATQVFANDTNVTITSSAGTHALGWTGTLSLTRGGSGAALTAANGGVVYSDAAKLQILAAGTSGQALTSGGAGAPTWSSYLPLAGGVMGGAIDMTAFAILQVGSITPASDHGSDLGSALKRFNDFYSLRSLNNDLILNGTTSGNIDFEASPATSSYSIVYPSAQGIALSILTNDGSGNLSWAIPVYNAEVSATGTVSGENSEWITSNCALSASVFTCTVSAFAGTPKCIAAIHGSTSGQVSVNPTSNTSVSVSTFAGTTGLAADRAFTLQCSK